MHAKYAGTVEQLIEWASADANITGVVLLGSQVRDYLTGDEWSDLDALVFARDAGALTGDAAWLQYFGAVICTAKETVDLSFAGLVWYVSRAVYDDGRVVDFNVIPADRLDAALDINRDIHAKGYRVIYDADGLLQEKLKASLSGYREEPMKPPSKEEIDGVVNDLLFHVVWTIKKARRGEVWSAVRCVNRYMNDLLLRMLEWHNLALGRHSPIRYDGRFLETRTDQDLLAGLRDCFSKYDAADVYHTAMR
jgi:aminoglycoside 6-adenylyltransferase